MGVLEAILAELQAIRTILAHQGQAPGAAAAPQTYAPNTALGQPAPQQFAPQPAPQQFAQQPAPQPTPAATPQQNVTADTITALITPHVGNPQIKQALGDQMRQMGINALPDTQPHQFNELFGRFQQVIAHFTGGGQQQPAPSSASII